MSFANIKYFLNKNFAQEYLYRLPTAPNLEIAEDNLAEKSQKPTVYLFVYLGKLKSK